jgi:hypothetical protein
MATLAIGAAQPAAGSEQPPDLANLHDTIQWIADRHPLRMSFLEPRWKSVDEWKKAIRPFFLERLSYRPPAQALRATTVPSTSETHFPLRP